MINDIRVKDVFKFLNGNVAVCDQEGQQIYPLQNILSVAGKTKDDCSEALLIGCRILKSLCDTNTQWYGAKNCQDLYDKQLSEISI